MVMLLIVFVVAISGCTSETTSNKTYSANGVTFVYPGNASEQNITALQATLGSAGEMLAVVGDNSSFKFGVAKINLDSNQKLASLSEWGSNINASIKSGGDTYVREKNVTVNGVDGIMMVFKDSTYYYHEAFFIKNNTGYLAILQSTSDNQQLFDQIIASLQTTQ